MEESEEEGLDDIEQTFMISSNQFASVKWSMELFPCSYSMKHVNCTIDGINKTTNG